MVMSDLFIPPEGAMQFELQRTPSSASESDQLWVQPLKVPWTGKRYPGCSCKHVFEVLAYTNPKYGSVGDIICRCMGRIIE